MSQIYECMFLINNDSVRAGWADVKSSVTGVVEKHGGKILSARRWGERRLAYPIRHRNRATYMLAFCDMPTQGVDPLSRELNLSETVLRYLFLAQNEVPAKELELSAAEAEESFTVPEPPEDDAIDEVPEEAPAAAENEDAPKAEGAATAEEAPAAEGAPAADAPAADAPAAAAPAAEAPAAEAAPAEAAAPAESEEKSEDTEKKEG